MKRIFLLLLLAFSLNAGATDNKYNFTDARDLTVIGKLTPDTSGPYSRFPGSLKGKVRDAVWGLSENSAGIAIRFSSDAGEFKARWTTAKSHPHENMTYILQAGMALYVFDKGEWVYVGSFRPGNAQKADPREFVIKCSKLAGASHEYMLYLGMYDSFTSVEIGVPEGSCIEMPKLESPGRSNPVIAYGTSILQGASASHPGLAGTNLLSRMLDREVINLGFSGNALLDMEVAEYMASFPTPGAYILDNAPNCSGDLILEKQEAFFRILRDAHPETPIFFVGMPLYPRVRFDNTGAENILGRHDAMLEVFKHLKKSGEKNIYYISADKVILDDNIGTIEGTHFTDIAFERWASAVAKALKRKLKD